MHQLNLKKNNLPEFSKNLNIHKFFIPLLFFVNFIANFTSPYWQLYDSALFKLQLIYPTIGLQSYKDFIVMYPFGPSLISIFATKFSYGLLKPINLVWIIHLLLQLILVKKIIQNKLGEESKISFLYLFLIFETLFYAKLGVEPLSLILIFITLIEFFRAHQENKIYISTFTYPTLMIFFKWDRLIFSAFVICLFTVLTRIKKINHTNFIPIKIMFVYAISLSLLFLSLYLFSPSNFSNAINYIFVDPFIVMKYRALPFVYSKPILSAYNFYYFLLLVYFFIFTFLIFTKTNSRKIFFFCVGLSMFPPTIFRSDVGHFIQFYLSSFFLIFCLPDFVEKILTKNHVRLFNFIKPTSIIVVSLFIIIELKAPLLKNTCANLNLEHKAKSIFVGNTQYDNFSVNFPLLYLNYLHLKPATKYIADDPGNQNSCSVGNEIINDFIAAPKPTIFFLNRTLLIDKNNKNSYNNCRKIEEYIASHTKIIGQCDLSDYNIEVRLSK
jgi:hypothetical protein